MDNMSKMRIEFEDEHLVVVYKPAGVLSQGDRTGEPSIVDYVLKYLKQPKEKDPYVGLVHRIDRPVAGLVILAKSKRAAELMSRLLRNDRIRKKYLAVVFGVPATKKARLTHYISEREGKPTEVFKEKKAGLKEAILEYEVLGSAKMHDIKEFDGSFSLVSIRLVTGRKHQIRTQLAAIGHPVVGDSKYFNQTKEVKEKMLKCNFLPWGEIALCSNYISFPHPLNNGTIVEVETSYPGHWIKIL
jgi:23S rRNA pseudouridine1911/1915/1917 synthase